MCSRGELIGKDSNPALVPDWPILMQRRTPNHHSSIGPKGRSEAALIGWGRSSCSCATLIGWENSVLVVELGFQELFCKGWLSGREHRADRWFSVVASP